MESKENRTKQICSVGIFNSWEILSPKVAIKKTDKSFFEYHGSGIPKKTKQFWDIENLQVGERRYIVLEYLNKKYNAYFEVINTASIQARMFWSVELGELFKSKVPHYINFKDKEEFPFLRFEKQTSMSYKVSLLLFYNEEKYLVDTTEEDKQRVAEEEIGELEGKKKEYLTTRYERKRQNREACILLYGTTCYVCGFDFERVYGDIGAGFIEVHHRNPLHLEGETIINPAKDLVPLCSNCHRMIHRKKDEILDVEVLKNIVSARNKTL